MNVNCKYPGCTEPAVSHCDCCKDSTAFCSDHGSTGGDREGGDNVHGNPHGVYAVPSACWKCGGFNADADPLEVSQEDVAAILIAQENLKQGGYR